MIMSTFSENEPPPQHALDLAEIRLHVGRYLDLDDLLACVLLNQSWNQDLTPFLQWTMLEYCDILFSRHAKRQQAQIALSPFEDPSSASRPHIVQCLKNLSRSPGLQAVLRQSGRSTFEARSFMAVALLAPFLQGPDAALTRFSLDETASSFKVFVSASFFEGYEVEVDLIADIIYKNQSLASFELGEQSPFWAEMCGYRWSNLSKESMHSEGLQPQWPSLRSVRLHDCRLEKDFLRFLLSQSPALEELTLDVITALGSTLLSGIPSSPYFQRDDSISAEFKAAVVSIHDHEERMAKVITTSQIRQLTFVAVEQGSMTELFCWARHLPKLEKFKFWVSSYCDFEPATLPIESSYGFPALKDLEVSLSEDLFLDDLHHVLGTLPQGLTGELKVVRSNYAEAETKMLLARHGATLTSLDLSNGGFRLTSHNPILEILCACPQLEKFLAPVWHSILENVQSLSDTSPKHEWVCRDLETLVVSVYTPQGRGLSQSFSSSFSSTSSLFPREAAAVAPKRFFERLNKLSKLKHLTLRMEAARSDINASDVPLFKNGYRTLKDGAKELEQVNILTTKPKGRRAISQTLTVEDAEWMVKHWPGLKSLKGLDRDYCGEFVEYLEKHRPEVRVEVD